MSTGRPSSIARLLTTGVLGPLAIGLAIAACAGGTDSNSSRPPAEEAEGPIATPTPTPNPRETETSLTALRVEPAFPALSFDRMVHLTYPDDASNRLFVVLQMGQITVFEDDPGVSSAGTFLDIRGRVSMRGNEEGLLGLAFDPRFRDNGYFYVYYSASDPRRSVVSRLSVSAENANAADPDSKTVILEVGQPFGNHNGGHLVFGPDGYLYVGLGDGGSGGDPQGNGQNPASLLGSILRIDVNRVDEVGTYVIPVDNPFMAMPGDAREEIWAYGLRNPWRFNFDCETGELWAADVGQNRFEEIDIVRPGGNYGWSVMEGLHCFREADCSQVGLELPVLEYGRADGCSVTGGYVYRGTRLESLAGAYVFADFCSGKIWALRYDFARVTEHLEIVDSELTIPGFGEDAEGELYVLSFEGGIYRLVP